GPRVGVRLLVELHGAGVTIVPLLHAGGIRLYSEEIVNDAHAGGLGVGLLEGGAVDGSRRSHGGQVEHRWDRSVFQLLKLQVGRGHRIARAEWKLKHVMDSKRDY